MPIETQIIKIHTNNDGSFHFKEYLNENNELHRTDGPAVENANGTKSWWQNGKCHRTDGPAVEYANGTKEWYQNGIIHREDGPAVECADGSKYWYQNDQRHRTDGPAIELANGYVEYYIHGEELTKEQFLQQTQPKKQLTVSQLEQLLGHKLEIIAE